MKTICIYHGDCPDGFGAAWVVRKALGEENVEFVPGFHGMPPPDCIGRHVILVDFSYKRAVMQELILASASVLVLDHHKSAQKDLAGLTGPNVTIKFDMSMSGVAMAWAHYFPSESFPQLLAHIQDLDLWQFKLPGTKDVTAGLLSYPYDFAVWDDLILNRTAGQLGAEGKVLNRRGELELAAAIKATKRTLVIGGYRVPVVNVPYRMASDAASLLAEGQPFAAAYFDTEEGRKFSLRSAPDGLDVSEIGAQYGGGGHEHASGFRLCWEAVVVMELRSANYREAA